MKTLTENSIHDLAQSISQKVQSNWQKVLTENTAKLEDAYTRGGDMAYGTYLGLLFRETNKQIKQAGFLLEPDLPGDLNISREWGDSTERRQQRVMWSSVTRGTEQLGVIAVVVIHDHTMFFVPEAPQVFGFETSDAIAALTKHFKEFAAAKPFFVEIEEYMAMQELETEKVSKDFIHIRGARENNLKNISIDIPKNQITVFTGVSGSGKSSLVFDTIAAEAQRQLNETFTNFVQGFLQSYGQPVVDSI